jgi:hypothetical protein
LFLVGFVAAAFASVLDDAASAALAGTACCAGAMFLFRAFDGNDFAEQFGLAVSLVGQVLLIVGLAQLMKLDDPAFYLAVAAVEAGLALLVPNFLHRVLAASGAAVALALAINQMSLHGLVAPLLCVGLALVWLDPRLWARRGALWRPIGYGLALALLLVETVRLFGAESWVSGAGGKAGWLALYAPLLGRSLTAALLVWVAILLGRREGLAPAGPGLLAAAGGAGLLGLLSLAAPGLASASLVLLIGFAAGNRILAALGIVALLGFVAHFYYSLQSSLLTKSAILAATGLCLLAAHVALARRGVPSETGHA